MAPHSRLIVAAAGLFAAAMIVVWSARLGCCWCRRVFTRGRRDEFVRRPDDLSGLIHGRARCRLCWWRAAQHRDHVVPASKGGPARRWNRRALCARCNTRRGARMSRWDWFVLLLPGPSDWPVWALFAAAVVAVTGR